MSKAARLLLDGIEVNRDHIGLSTEGFFDAIKGTRYAHDVQLVYASLPIPDAFFFPDPKIRPWNEERNPSEDGTRDGHFLNWAFKTLGVESKLRFRSVTHREYPGNDTGILGYYNRKDEGLDSKLIKKIDLSKPISPELQEALEEAARAHKGYMWPEYVCTDSSGDNIYTDRLERRRIKSKREARILTALGTRPQSRVRAVLSILEGKGYPPKEVIQRYLEETYGFRPMPSDLSTKFEIEFGPCTGEKPAYPVITGGKIPENFQKHASIVYSVNGEVFIYKTGDRTKIRVDYSDLPKTPLGLLETLSRNLKC